MLAPKTFLLLFVLCLLFRYSVCDGPGLRACSRDTECASYKDAFCESAAACKCDAGFYPYIGGTPVEAEGVTSPNVKCLNISVCRPGLNQCNSHGECYRYGEVFRCVCNYGYSGTYCEIDSYATTTPRMTLTTKSTRRGIENFLRFGVIPAAGGTCILIYLILIIIFRPMPSADPF